MSVHSVPGALVGAQGRPISTWRALGFAVFLVSLSACSGACKDTAASDTPVLPEVTGEPKGIALALGLNRVDPAHYGGWSGPLAGCEYDAGTMKAIAAGAGLSAKTLLSANARRQTVLDEIAGAAAQLGAGDLFVLSYSGHGGQVPDVNGDDPNDGQDETWCLYDGEFLDDELYTALGAFGTGVRVLVLSDSCHSGTMLRMKREDFERTRSDRHRALESDWSGKSRASVLAVRGQPAPDPATFAVRAMPPGVAIETFLQNQPFYEEIGRKAPRDARASVKCQALLISGCEDAQLSNEVGGKGVFTQELERAWNGGAFAGGHPAFHQTIQAAVLARIADQSPAYSTVGQPIPDFEAQKPYTLIMP